MMISKYKYGIPDEKTANILGCVNKRIVCEYPNFKRFNTLFLCMLRVGCYLIIFSALCCLTNPFYIFCRRYFFGDILSLFT